ncbi:hypothetical protein Hanom_Chr17g01588541 [Helianthus anomalus]
MFSALYFIIMFIVGFDFADWDLQVPTSLSPSHEYRYYSGSGKRTANQCLEGFLVFDTRILDQPNLRYPFTNFFLEVLKYFRLSLGQLAPVGVARIMHFEILCRALSYEPSLLMFHRFFWLARNGDWYTIEKTQCEAPLLSAIVGHTYAWKNQFFFYLLLPFPIVPRKFSEVLNEKEPEVHELERELLLRLRPYRTKLKAYQEELLVDIFLLIRRVCIFVLIRFNRLNYF